ncbi:MAG: hypothetical protein WAT20_03065 [Ferruginibacter sp.]|nr:hypothetical protein [Chitinophagaceae bacterium]
MKKITVLTLIVCVFASCKKDNNTSNNNNSAPRSFTCTINGVAFVADSAWYNNFNAGATNIFAVKGTGASLEYFEINLNAQTATTYAIPANAFTFLNSFAAYVATSGSLSIGTYDMTNRKISGTFTNVTAGAFTISGGTFTNLPYK